VVSFVFLLFILHNALVAIAFVLTELMSILIKSSFLMGNRLYLLVVLTSSNLVMRPLIQSFAV